MFKFTIRAPYTREKRPRHTFNMGLSGGQSQSGSFTTLHDKKLHFVFIKYYLRLAPRMRKSRNKNTFSPEHLK